MKELSFLFLKTYFLACMFLARKASALVTPILSIRQRISYYGKDEPREARPNLAEGLILFTFMKSPISTAVSPFPWP